MVHDNVLAVCKHYSSLGDCLSLYRLTIKGHITDHLYSNIDLLSRDTLLLTTPIVKEKLTINRDCVTGTTSAKL